MSDILTKEQMYYWKEGGVPVLKPKDDRVYDSHEALREQLALAVDALQFVGMPITTPKDLLTVDRLLATIAEDNQRVRETLKKLGVE